MQFGQVTANYSLDFTKQNDTGLDGYEGLLLILDTQREKDIDLGPKWPFDPLGEGECIVNEKMLSTYTLKKD